MLTTETKESIRFYLLNLSVLSQRSLREISDATARQVLREVEPLIRVVDEDICKDKEAAADFSSLNGGRSVNVDGTAY